MRAFLKPALTFVLFTSSLAGVTAWPEAVTDYRALLQQFSKNVTEWSQKALALRAFMIQNDPDYPIYHHTAPEGWINDPNGVTWDETTGLYHRFYQYDKTFNETCMHGVTTSRQMDSVHLNCGVNCRWQRPARPGATRAETLTPEPGVTRSPKTW